MIDADVYATPGATFVSHPAVAQVGRAPGSFPGGRTFDSFPPDYRHDEGPQGAHECRSAGRGRYGQPKGDGA